MGDRTPRFALNVSRKLETPPLAETPKIVLCPYCGNAQQAPADRCGACGGFFDPLSRRVTQQYMGPWFVRDAANPFRPGCSYDVLVKDIKRGKVKASTVVRGPTTRQFWSIVRNVPGLSHLVGYCYQCGEHVVEAAPSCPKCAARFLIPSIRDQLGLEPLDPSVLEAAKTAATAKTGAAPGGPSNGRGSALDAPLDPPTNLKSDAQTEDLSISSLLASITKDSNIGEEIPAGNISPAQNPPSASPLANASNLVSATTAPPTGPAVPPPAALMDDPASDDAISASERYRARYGSSNSQKWVVVLLILINVGLVGGFVWYLVTQTQKPVQQPGNQPTQPNNNQPANPSTPEGNAPTQPNNTPGNSQASQNNNAASTTTTAAPTLKIGDDQDLDLGSRSGPRAKLNAAGIEATKVKGPDTEGRVSFFGIDKEGPSTEAKRWLDKFNEAIELEKQNKLTESHGIIVLIMNNIPEPEWPRELVEADHRLKAALEKR